MTRNILILILAILSQLPIKAQEVKLASKTLKGEKQYLEYMKDHVGKLVYTNPSGILKYYECDNNSVVIENTVEKYAIVYLDKNAYYKERQRTLKSQREEPLKEQMDSSWSIQVDSILKNQSFVYKYTVIKRNGKPDTIYVVKATAAVLGKGFEFANDSLKYACFYLYDEPTGVTGVLLYDYKTAKVYRSEWYNMSALGDDIVPDKVNFKTMEVVVKEAQKDNSFYRKRLKVIKRRTVDNSFYENF